MDDYDYVAALLKSSKDWVELDPKLAKFNVKECFGKRLSRTLFIIGEKDKHREIHNITDYSYVISGIGSGMFLPDSSVDQLKEYVELRDKLGILNHGRSMTDRELSRLTLSTTYTKFSIRKHYNDNDCELLRVLDTKEEADEIMRFYEEIYGYIPRNWYTPELIHLTEGDKVTTIQLSKHSYHKEENLNFALNNLNKKK